MKAGRRNGCLPSRRRNPCPSLRSRSGLAKEIRFDPDVPWIVEIEDRSGRHFLDLAKA